MFCGVGGSISISGVFIPSCGCSMVVISLFLFPQSKLSSGGAGSLAESAVPCPPPASELPNFTVFSPLIFVVSVFGWGGASSISCFMVYLGYVFVFVFLSSGKSSFRWHSWLHLLCVLYSIFCFFPGLFMRACIGDVFSFSCLY